MKKIKGVIEKYDKYVMNTYTRVPLCLERGKGAWIEDIDGRRYLDFFPGWAVSGIGHCHKSVIDGIVKQSKKILHVSNNYYNQAQSLLAKKIIENSFPGRVFFCNSGAEANEGAIKLARRYGHHTNRFEVITMHNSFHGRTLATIAATGQNKVKVGFNPLPVGFIHVPFNDMEALKEAISDRTIAIMLEPIQCEGGINIADKEYLKAVREICNREDLVLILDEVQTGMGRTGRLFCFQHYGIVPDVITLAKSLGGGLPIGAMVARRKFANVLTPGTHASTFGGSPIVCRAALGVFEAIEKGRLLDNAKRMGKILLKGLESLKAKYRFMKEIRGMALTVGVELSIKGDEIVRRCTSQGLLINCTHEKVLRIMPPLTVTKKEIKLALNILDGVLKRT